MEVHVNVKNFADCVDSGDVYPWNESLSFLFFLYAAKFNYFENQDKLHGLYSVATNDDYVISSSVTSWYEEYIKWARREKPGQYFDQSTTPCK